MPPRRRNQQSCFKNITIVEITIVALLITTIVLGVFAYLDLRVTMGEIYHKLLADTILFDSNLIKNVLAPTTMNVASNYSTATAPCIHYNGHNYVIGPRHLRLAGSLDHPYADIALLSPTVLFAGYHESVNFLIIDEANMKNPSLGDQLLSFGFYGNAQSYWSGKMIHETTTFGTLSDLESCPVDEFCKPANEFVRMYATDGIQFPGMSGALVINGCGVVGIALQYAIQHLNGTDMVAGAQVMDIHLLLDLLSSEYAPRYRIDASKVKSLLVLPTKSYCNLTH